MTRTRTSRRAIGTIVTLALAACGRTGADVADNDQGQIPPPAAALARQEAIGLERRLELLDSDLGRVLDGNLDGEAQAALLAAEAATDRLLEEQPGAEWLGTGYFLEARLRQIQALADRIVAEMQRGVARELVLEEVAALRLSVRDLRTQLAARGNGSAPPPLESLLVASANDPRPRLGGGSGSSTSRDTTTAAAAPAAEPTVAPAGGPLGEPIRP